MKIFLSASSPSSVFPPWNVMSDVVPIIIDGDSFPVEEKPLCDSNVSSSLLKFMLLMIYLAG